MSIRDFYEFFYRRGPDPKIKTPKAVEASFGKPQSHDERAIKALIEVFNEKQAGKFEEDLFKQRKQLADTERILQTKPTKKAVIDPYSGARAQPDAEGDGVLGAARLSSNCIGPQHRIERSCAALPRGASTPRS
jgi:hypothetical protein